MRNEEMVNDNTPLRQPSDLFYRRYKFLIRPKHLGRAATQAFMNIGQILYNKPVVKSVEQLFIQDQKASEKRTDEKAERMKNLSKVVAKSNEVLATAHAVFPFDLFPDTVIVDRTKVTIIKHGFFWSAETISIRIEDILNVTTGVGPLFGSLTVASRVMSSVDHFKINYFWRKDAIHLKHIIQGYVIAHHNKIDVSHLSNKDLIDTLSELGHDATA